MGDFFRRAAAHVRLLGQTAPAWRSPQRGALGAILAHWSLDEPDPTVVSIPTGSGKTAVAMAAPFLAREPPRRVLVLAPAQQLRRQLATEFSSYAQLRRLGIIPEEVDDPIVMRMQDVRGIAAGSYPLLSPSSSLISRMAAITLAMCSSRSMPRSSTPCRTLTRSTPAAKAEPSALRDARQGNAIRPSGGVPFRRRVSKRAQALQQAQRSS